MVTAKAIATGKGSSASHHPASSSQTMLPMMRGGPVPMAPQPKCSSRDIVSVPEANQSLLAACERERSATDELSAPAKLLVEHCAKLKKNLWRETTGHRPGLPSGPMQVCRTPCATRIRRTSCQRHKLMILLVEPRGIEPLTS
jgi:hypothetical protein